MNALAIALCLFAGEAYAGGWAQQQLAGMNVWVYAPASKGNANALVINLHGCGQHAADLKELGNWEEAAERHQMIVAIPDVPGGGVVMGCWNYFGRSHNEASGHNRSLIALAESLLADPALQLDKKKMYISGLSSGATQALTVACLRPDLFSGVAINSGPSLGSEMSEISRPRAGPQEVARLCRSFSGGRSFELQKAVLIRGEPDFVVNTQHTAVNSEALAEVYGSPQKRPLDLKTFPGANTQGTAELFSHASEGRVLVIVNQGLAHNWASGSGKGAAARYVNPQSVNFPEVLAAFFSNAPQLATPRFVTELVTASSSGRLPISWGANGNRAKRLRL